MEIMCKMGVNFNAISSHWDIPFTDYFRDELDRLLEFEEVGLIVCKADRLIITEKGRLFLRNIAMCFDYYLNQKSTVRRYSKTV